MTNSSRSLFHSETITTPSNGTGIETLTAPMDFFGPPGKYVELHMLANIEGDTRRDTDRRDDSSPREFKVSAILGRSHIFVDSQLPVVSANNGDSFLVGPAEFSNLEVELDGRIYVFHKNTKEEYSYVEFECEAVHYKQAEYLFYLGLTSYLDALAYKGNCPIFIQAVRIEDVHNQIVVLPQISPYRRQSVSLGDMVIYPELNSVYAMYRESKNASSNFYRFLCLYKILEGLFGAVRPQLFKRAKALKLAVDQSPKRIPNDMHLIPDHRKYIGMSIRSFFETVLTPQFRHGVAHFMLRDGTAMNLSSPQQVDLYTHIVYITELCLRALVDDCENILAKLSDAARQSHS
jgi:hypothetical protein